MLPVRWIPRPSTSVKTLTLTLTPSPAMFVVTNQPTLTQKDFVHKENQTKVLKLNLREGEVRT